MANTQFTPHIVVRLLAADRQVSVADKLNNYLMPNHQQGWKTLVLLGDAHIDPKYSTLDAICNAEMIHFGGLLVFAATQQLDDNFRASPMDTLHVSYAHLPVTLDETMQFTSAIYDRDPRLQKFDRYAIVDSVCHQSFGYPGKIAICMGILPDTPP
jgi:hypothetical protein